MNPSMSLSSSSIGGMDDGMRTDSELELKSTHPHEHGMKVGAFQQSCCPICLERYTTENPAVLFRCEHSFHFQCIDDWWQRSNKCPVCDRTMKRRHAREGGAPATPPRDGGSESSGEEDIFPVSQGRRPPPPVQMEELEEGDVMTDDEVMQFFSAEELDRLSRHPVLARHAQSRGLVQADLLRELLARRGAAAVGGQRRRSSPIQRSMDRRRQRRESIEGGTPTSDHPLTPTAPSPPNQPDTPTPRPPPPPHTSNTNHERIRLTSGAAGGSDDDDINAPHHHAHCCCCSALHLIGRGASYILGSLTTGGGVDTTGQPQSTIRSTLGLRSAIGVAMPPSPNGSSSRPSSPVVPVPPTKVLS